MLPFFFFFFNHYFYNSSFVIYKKKRDINRFTQYLLRKSYSGVLFLFFLMDANFMIFSILVLFLYSKKIILKTIEYICSLESYYISHS